MAAITLQFEVGPETRALIERLAGKVIVEVEFGPRRQRIEEFLRKALSEPYLGVVRPAHPTA
jgi:hypothetical protein